MVWSVKGGAEGEAVRQLMRTSILILAVPLLGACAGGPIAIKAAPGAREVTIGGSVIVVSQSDGLWGATHRDFLANNLYVSAADNLRRKAQFIQAIESVSKCKVVESTMDQGAAALNAMVRC
jgi:hypothetical protein